MNGYKPKELKSLLEKRRKLLHSYEVLAFDISEVNKKISGVFTKTYFNKTIRFIEGNNILYLNDKNEVLEGIPCSSVFDIMDVKSANTFDDITYTIRNRNTGDCIAVRQDQFHSFIFEDEQDDD